MIYPFALLLVILGITLANLKSSEKKKIKVKNKLPRT
jgi:hypothetical protein